MTFGLYEVLSFPWQPIIQTGFRQYTSAYVKHGLANLEPNENLDIASSFSIQTCKSAYLHNHEYSLKLTFLQNRSIKNPETNHI